MSFDAHSSIRDVLGDAPDEARNAAGRADLAGPDGVAAGGVESATTEDPMERHDMRDGAAADEMAPDGVWRDAARRDEAVSGMSREPGLSTADVANVAAPAAVEDERAAASRGGKGEPAAGAPAASARNSNGHGNGTGDGARPAPLFPTDQAASLRDRWMDLQAGFVDEPQSAVQQADGLVAEVIQRLAKSFADERSQLEHQWEGGGDVSTEDLRVALRRYRSFFDRLLSL